MADDAPFLPGLSPVAGKPVQITFDAGRLTSDGGILLLAEIERSLAIAERLRVGLAVLLVVGAMSQNELAALYREAHALDLDAIVEIHDDEELERALELDCDVIGINNRNLEDFSVDLATTFDLSINAILQHVLFVAGVPVPDVAPGCAGVQLANDLSSVGQTIAGVRLGNGLQIFPGSVPIYRGGTLVGVRCPSWVGGLNVPGYHWHFLSEDRTVGGHVLDCRVLEGRVGQPCFDVLIHQVEAVVAREPRLRVQGQAVQDGAGHGPASTAHRPFPSPRAAGRWPPRASQRRSRRLKINYRTSHQIRAQADRLLPASLSDVDGNAESRRGTVSVFNGPPPVVKTFRPPS